MTYEEFVKRVEERAGLDRAAAEKVTGAVLATLGERLDRREREEIAPQLAKELKEPFNRYPERHTFEVDEFFDRVAERADIGVRDSLAQTRVVLGVLKEAVDPGTWSKLLVDMPEDYHVLLK